MESQKWFGRVRMYEKDRKVLPCIEASSHPLKSITVSDTKVRKTGTGSGSSTPKDGKSSGRATPLDPLSSAMEGSDPLSRLAAEKTDPLSMLAASSASNVTDIPVGHDPLSVLLGEMDLAPSRKNTSSSWGFSESVDDTFEPWSSKCPAILARYTTSEKLSITTSYLPGASERATIAAKNPSTVTDKVKNRLEQLDDFEEGSVQEMLNLSQQEYCSRIEELNNALITAWEQDQRVKALKIVIQCAKMLASVAVIPFYPSKFVLITNILDTFGRLVYDRIRNKAQYIPKGSNVPIQLPENFTPDQVPESAKETCRNWFFKIASIRELIPRMYVEAAILKCYSFLTTGEYEQALQRLALMTRGIGDPLVAVYARCYLCRVGILVAPKVRQHVMPCFEDFLVSYSQISNPAVQEILDEQRMERRDYLPLYSPALDWILQCLANGASEKTLHDVMTQAQQRCNSALLLNSIMCAFQPEYISSRGLEFCTMIRSCEELGFPAYLLYRSLGICLVLAEPPEDQHLNLLNDVWKVVMKLKLPAEYITVAEVWIEFVVKHFQKRELNTILGDIIKHMTPDRVFEQHYSELQSIICKVLNHNHDFALLFSLDNFLPFLDMFQKESIKVEVCKNIMQAYSKWQTEPTKDPVIMNSLMYICKTMHDHVNALSLEDEVREVGLLISSYIRSIDFGKDFEQQLTFYVEARAAFSNIDFVLCCLVQNVNRLAILTKNIVKGSHTRKTAAFVRACAAYSFITIPSLNGIFCRLQLYLASGQSAMLNHCISQGDAFFKAAISLIPEVPKSMDVDGKARSCEPFLLDFVNNFTAMLLYIPDNPDQGVLYLLKGLVNVLDTYTWDRNSDYKVMSYMNVLALLSAYTQETYQMHIEKVESNDKLYGQDPKFLSEVAKVASMLVDLILNHLTMLEKAECYKRQAHLSCEFISRLLAHGDLQQSAMTSLVTKLWQLANKSKQADPKILQRTSSYMKIKLSNAGTKDLSELYAFQGRPISGV